MAGPVPRRRLADLPVLGYVLAPWSLLSDVRAALLLHGKRIQILEDFMAADRDLLNKLLTVLPATLEKVRAVIGENQSLRAENARLREDADTDEAADLDALRPLEDAVTALDQAVTPASDQAPDVTPVSDVSDVPAVLGGGGVDGGTDDTTVG